MPAPSSEVTIKADFIADFIVCSIWYQQRIYGCLSSRCKYKKHKNDIKKFTKLYYLNNNYLSREGP